MNRKEYMREYKRRYRAAHGIEKHDGDAFVSLSCLPIETAEQRGGGAICGWGLVFEDLSELHGEDVSSLLGAFKSVKQRNTVFITNLKIWARFLIVELKRLNFKQADDTNEKNTYKIVENGYGDYLSFEINNGGVRTFIRSFNELIRTDIADAYKSFCGGDMYADMLKEERANGDLNITAAHIIRVTMGRFRQVFFDLFKMKTNASSLSLLAQYGVFATAGRGSYIYGQKVFNYYFPDTDTDTRERFQKSKVYRGGWNYISDAARTYTGAGYVLDINSCYPAIYAAELPVFESVKHTFSLIQKTGDDPINDLLFERYRIYKIAEVYAELKPDGVPTIQLINSKTGTEYLKKISFDNDFEFFLDSNDVKTLFENYDVKIFTISGFYDFHLQNVPFLTEFAQKLYSKKSSSDGAIKTVSKGLLNSFAGRFGMKDRGYMPAAIFINSRARYYISEIARLNKNIFLYSDTDSIIIQGEEIPENLKKLIGDGLGQFSVKKFKACKFYGLKRYSLDLVGTGWRHVGETSDTSAAKIKIYPDGTLAFDTRETIFERRTRF